MSDLRRAVRATIASLPTDRIYYFHHVVAALLISNKSSGGVPQLPAALYAQLRERVRDEQLDVDKAEDAVEQIRQHFFGASTERVPLVVCPLLDAKPKTPSDICCLIEQGEKAGCDSGAGTIYRAKTNGLKIWLAQSVAAPVGRSQFSFLGFDAGGSEREFVLLHEFGHVLYEAPATKLLFDRLRRLYWEAAKELTQQERVKKFINNETDFHELAASMFALATMRSDLLSYPATAAERRT